MILCGVCDTWQHAVCFDVLKQEEAPQFHVCVDCAKVRLSAKVERCCLLFSKYLQRLT